MKDVYKIITVVSSILMAILILLQTRGADLGAGFGSAGEIHTTRRGSDKVLFQLTIIIGVIFVLSIVFGIITAK